METKDVINIKKLVLTNEYCLNRLNNGKTILLIDITSNKSIINNYVGFVKDNNLYGIGYVFSQNKINHGELTNLYNYHGLSEENIKKWWPRKEIIYSLKIKPIFIFDPVKIEYENLEYKNIINNFTIPEELKLNFPENPEKLSGLQLTLFKNYLDSLFVNNTNSLCSTQNHSSSEACVDINSYELGYKYNQFGNIFEAVEHMYINGSTFIVEQEHDGVQCTLVKKGDNCSIYAHNKRDIGSIVPNLTKQIENIILGDVALDCRLCVEGLSKKELKKLLEKVMIGEIEYDFSSANLYVVDCLYYGKDVRNMEYIERKNLLSRLNYTNNIIETPYLLVKDKSDMAKCYNIMHVVNDVVSIKSNNSDQAGIIIDELSESSISNHNYFSKMSNDVAYYIGFLSCDGHVDTKTNRVEIHISPDDSEIIKGLQNKLGDKRNITNGFLKFKSKEIVKDLAKYDMSKLKPERKTFNKIPDSQKWPFIRGCFDADGTIMKSKLQFDSGNRAMVKWMYEQLKKVGGENVKYYNYDSTSKCTVYEKAVKSVHSKIYSGSSPSLQRKKNYLQNKNSLTETTTDSAGIDEVQGKQWKKKIIKPGQKLSEESVIKSDKSFDNNFKVYLIQSGEKYIVKSVKIKSPGVEEIKEYYKFDTKDKAEKVYKVIYNEF